MSITFQKATKHQLKARIALDGPTGAGKTWTALESAVVLGKRIVMIDTERGSGALYSDHFDFDYYRFDPPYDPATLVAVLKAAEEQGYEVVIIDSLSHFWEGEGGTLDIVDAAAQRSQNNSFAGWKVGTPALRNLIDTILGIDAHVIVTMRSKMEYVLETNEKGKQVPRKVGMAPVMRAGVEFEFTLVGDMDLEHRMVISKSRCSALADQVIQPNRAAEMATTFKAWLESGEPLVNREQIQKLSEIFAGIADVEERKRVKNLFRDAYDVPDRLLASQFDEALAFARELAGNGDETVATEGDAPAEAPVADHEPEGTEPPALVVVTCVHGVDPDEDFCVACHPETAPPPRSRNGRRPAETGAPA